MRSSAIAEGTAFASPCFALAHRFQLWLLPLDGSGGLSFVNGCSDVVKLALDGYVVTLRATVLTVRARFRTSIWSVPPPRFSGR
ncbi:hypothetical protein [Actinoplanes palleronii]|uniref:hypothetical protein n=1 Tax=Actinoplanes palleronii TaxID=113570 RepID=UPI0019436030|nr:hypothetical protein [Actinoplanes palleronii]